MGGWVMRAHPELAACSPGPPHPCPVLPGAGAGRKGREGMACLLGGPLSLGVHSSQALGHLGCVSSTVLGRGLKDRALQNSKFFTAYKHRVSLRVHCRT